MLLTWPLFVRKSSSSVKLLLSELVNVNGESSSSAKLLLSKLVNVNEDVRRFIMCLPKRSFSGCGSKGVDSWAAALMQTTVRCHALEALHRLHCTQRKMMQ
jgi:hypothetical protein